GQATARLLAQRFVSFENFENQMCSLMGKEELTQIDGIGDVMAEDIIDFFAEKNNLDLLEKLKSDVVIQKYENNQKQSALTGKTIVFTGTLENMTRDEAKAMALSVGAKVSGSVSSKTDFVVLGENAGSKEKTARSLGVAIIDEKEFKQMLENI
ncbi:MAG: BRCT domain-containing protein, partial [Alphaproteobacteria bacterium]